MKTCTSYFVRTAFVLAAAALLISVAGCDHDYRLNYGRTYIVPRRSASYYAPYADVDYVSYEYPYYRSTLSYYYTPHVSFHHGWHSYRSPHRRYSCRPAGRVFHRGRRGHSKRCR